MKKRIWNIRAAYSASITQKKCVCFIAISVDCCTSAQVCALLAHSAAIVTHAFQEEGKTISYLDLSAAFGKNTVQALCCTMQLTTLEKFIIRKLPLIALGSCVHLQNLQCTVGSGSRLISPAHRKSLERTQILL